MIALFKLYILGVIVFLLCVIITSYYTQWKNGTKVTSDDWKFGFRFCLWSWVGVGIFVLMGAVFYKNIKRDKRNEANNR